jgi:hypothetical protein
VGFMQDKPRHQVVAAAKLCREVDVGPVVGHRDVCGDKYSLEPNADIC